MSRWKFCQASKIIDDDTFLIINKLIIIGLDYKVLFVRHLFATNNYDYLPGCMGVRGVPTPPASPFPSLVSSEIWIKGINDINHFVQFCMNWKAFIA